MLNEAARRYLLSIGGVDYSKQMVSLTGTTAHLSGQAGGLCQFEGGSLVLDEGANSINVDLDIELFKPRTPIVLKVSNQLGIFEDFPHLLAIERASYDRASRTTTIQCADRLALSPEREATSIFAIGVSIGTPLSANSIVANCLAATGINTKPFIVGASLITLVPPDISRGNYRTAAADMLDATETVGWIDADGEFTARPLDLEPLSADFVVDPSVFEPVDLGQSPSEESDVSGSFNYVYERDDPPTVVSDSPEIRTESTTFFDYSGATRTTVTETELLGSEIYAAVQGVGAYPSGKTLSTRVRDIDTYEQSNSGKLLSKVVSTDLRKISAHGTLAGWLAEDDAKEELVGTGQETLGDYLWSDLFLPGKIDRTEWSYDSKEQIRGIVKTVSMTRGEALGRLGSGLDWRLVDERTILNDMTLVERQEETWISHGPRDWEVKTRKRTARALHSNNASNLTSRFQAVEELFDAAVINLNEKKSFYSALIAEALDMIDVQPDQNPDRKTDGSLTPPETQRKPARFYAEPGQIKITSGLPLNNPQGEIRRDSTTIPYLPDANGDAVAGSGAQVDRAGIWALKRAYLAACRFHGKRIRAAIPNSMLSEFAPFKCFDVSADGQTYRLALDGVTWTFTRTACYFEADAPLLMSGPTGGTLELPYNKPQF